MNLRFKDNNQIKMSDYKYYLQEMELMEKRLREILKKESFSDLIVEILNIYEQNINIKNAFYNYKEISSTNKNIIAYNQINKKSKEIDKLFKNDIFLNKIKNIKIKSKKIKLLINKIINGVNFNLTIKSKNEYEDDLLRQYKNIVKCHKTLDPELVHNQEERKLIYDKKNKIDNYFNLLNIIKYRNYESKKFNYKNFDDYIKQSTVFSSNKNKKTILDSMIDFYYNESIKLYPKLINEDGYNILYNIVNKNKSKIYFDSTKFIIEFINLVEDFYNVKIIFDGNLHLKNSNLFYIEKDKKIIGQIKMFLSKTKYDKVGYSTTLDKKHKEYNTINYIYINNFQNNNLFDIEQINYIAHEFGHAMHDILSEEDCFSLSGLNIEDDVVEIPSQLFEYLVMEKEFLKKIYNRNLNNRSFTDGLYKELKREQQNPFFNLICAGKALMDYELFSNKVSNKNDIKIIEDNVNKKVFKDIDYRLNISDELFIYGKSYDLDGRYNTYLFSDIYSYFFAKNLDKKDLFIEKFINIKRSENMLNNLNSIINIKDAIEFYKNNNKY